MSIFNIVYMQYSYCIDLILTRRYDFPFFPASQMTNVFHFTVEKVRNKKVLINLNLVWCKNIGSCKQDDNERNHRV